MDNRFVSVLPLRSAILGAIVGFAFSLLMYAIVLIASPTAYYVLLHHNNIDLPIRFASAGFMGGFLVGYIIRLIGEFTHTAYPQQCRNAVATEAPLSRRQTRRMRFFWVAFYGVLFLGLVKCIIWYWKTTHVIDGCEEIGWPWPFILIGGYPYRECLDLQGLALDLAFWLSMATITGLIVRDGLKRFSIKSLLVLRYFLGVSKRSKCNHDLP